MALHLAVLHDGATQSLPEVPHKGARRTLRLCVCLLSDPVVQVLGCPLCGPQALGDLGPRSLWGGEGAEVPGWGRG